MCTVKSSSHNKLDLKASRYLKICRKHHIKENQERDFINNIKIANTTFIIELYPKTRETCK